MRKLRCMWFVVGLFSCGLLASCGGGGGGTGAVVNTLGLVEGYAFIPTSGLFTILFGRSATPPVGTQPLSGAGVSVVGQSATATTEANGHFLLRDVPAGLRTLRLTPTGGTASDFPLTVLGGATINVGAPPVSRQVALDSVKQAVALIKPLDQVYVLAPQQPLPAGAVVTPTLGNDQGDDDPALEYQVPAAQWLVYVDLHPHAGFQHRVLYYLVDVETGQVTTREATSWPAVNGLMYYGREDINIASADLVQAPTRAAPGRSASRPVVVAEWDSRASRDHVPGCTNPQTYALVIQGSIRGDFDTDMSSVANFLNIPLHGAKVNIYEPPRTTHVDGLQDIKLKFKEICDAATECDTLYIYISSHGNPDGSTDLMQGPHDNGYGVQQDKIRFKAYQELLIEQCKACHIIVHMDTCFSGKALADFQQHIQKFDKAFKGKKVLLLASASADEYGFGRPKPLPPGSWFGQEMLEEFRALIQAAPGPLFVLTVDQVSQAFDRALPRVKEGTKDELSVHSPERYGQNPVKWLRPMEPGETCHLGGTATRWVVDLNQALTIGETVYFKKGERIPLAWIKDYFVAEAHTPVTTESGCAYRHLHSAAGTIRIQKPGQPERGPFGDPDQSHCGYGQVLDAPFD
jgi:hypothetical protein